MIQEPKTAESTQAQASRQAQNTGIECPACGCRHLPVYYSRPRKGYILRVRTCRHCGRRVVTRERL